MNTLILTYLFTHQLGVIIKLSKCTKLKKKVSKKSNNDTMLNDDTMMKNMIDRIDKF